MTKPEAMRPAQAAATYGISRRTLARRAKDDPEFPQPIRLSLRLVLYRTVELESYFTRKQWSKT